MKDPKFSKLQSSKPHFVEKEVIAIPHPCDKSGHEACIMQTEIDQTPVTKRITADDSTNPHREQLKELEAEIQHLRVELQAESVKTHQEIEKQVSLQQQLARIKEENKITQQSLVRIQSESLQRIKSLNTELIKMSQHAEKSNEAATNKMNALVQQLETKETALMIAQSAVQTKAQDIEVAEREIQSLKVAIDEAKKDRRHLMLEADEKFEKLQQELQSVKQEALDRNECIYCYDADADYAFVPCGHLCLCQTCSQPCKEQIAQNRSVNCYMCNAKALDIVRIFTT